MEKEFDLKQTVLSTLLNYLEIETNGYLKVGQETYMNYRVNFLKQTFEKLLEAHEWLHVFRKFGVADKKSSQTIALEDVFIRSISILKCLP